MSLEEFRVLCGGIEFWGEMKARLAGEETSWLTADMFYPRGERRILVPQPTTRPAYTATFDLSGASKIDRYHKVAKKKDKKWVRNYTEANLPPELMGVKFGGLTVVNRIPGKWVVQCMCGAIEHRTSKAIRNPANSFDACMDCRRPIGKLRSDIFHELGVEVTWEDCFLHLYGAYLEKEEEGNDSDIIQ